MPAQVDLAATSAHLFDELLRRTHLSSAYAVPGVIAEVAALLGARDVVLSVIDREQEHLVPLLLDGEPGVPAPVDGTLAGRAFATSAVVQADAAEAGHRRAWWPLQDGTERVGTLEMTLPAPDGVLAEDVVALGERFTHAVAQVVVTKSAYGDAFERARRLRPMSVSAELISRMVPPAVFATDGLVIAGLLEPAYESGGDCYDYAVNRDVAHLAMFDAMGHGLAAAGVSAFAVSAYRAARRRGLTLEATYAEMDTAVTEQYGGERFTTAVLAELDVGTGDLRWISAGHPAPLLLRQGRVVKTLEAPPATPLGVPFGAGPPVIAHEQLEPGDMVLLFTDGLPEARLPDGEFFGLDRLAAFVEVQAASGFPAPETLRRLRHAVLGHQRGALQDDASALLVEWRRGTELALLPDTA